MKDHLQRRKLYLSDIGHPKHTLFEAPTIKTWKSGENVSRAQILCIYFEATARFMTLASLHFHCVVFHSHYVDANAQVACHRLLANSSVWILYFYLV